MVLIYFGIGTNLGNREANLREALQLLDERVGEQLACSSVYRSAPMGFVSDNEFANIVAVYETEYSPEEVLLITQQIEREKGRTEKSVNGVYHDRVIDIDLLQVTHHSSLITHHSSTLTLPHPRMQERDFVMIPLREAENALNTKL
ncbi:MAG: 2-amino-4-hydroxy-6-hydroxymethyldihydropteridine diphosphokinase [Paludibacteraceae bacterium]|nr:2-amino-4-hydroxy-6-hydroxymethyldihydropteridine diphosphokinase [Paludibacteraceae bacterium]